MGQVDCHGRLSDTSLLAGNCKSDHYWAGELKNYFDWAAQEESISRGLCLVILPNFLTLPLSPRFDLALMPNRHKLIVFVFALVFLSSCDRPDRTSRTEERLAEEQFFKEEAVSSLDQLTNQMREAPTAFLRTFKDDPIPWQAWNSSVTEKARACQAPILGVVISSQSETSRTVVESIISDPDLLPLFRDKNVCALIDIHAHPEFALLSYIVSSENRKSVGFPMLIWMSHEAAPLGSVELSSTTSTGLASVINHSSAMVDDIWSKSSDYAVKNSRRDAESRQARIDELIAPTENAKSRNYLFTRYSREISSYFDPISGNLDGAGGLVPSSSLELLSIASLSPLVREEIQERAKAAITRINETVISGAVHDPLDGGFFHARRSPDWNIPSFSKSAVSQSQIVKALIKSGDATGNQHFTDSGIRLLQSIERNLITPGYSSSSAKETPTGDNGLLWDWETLNKILTETELAVASQAFDLKESGNIPALADPDGQYFGLNNLPQPHDSASLSRLLNKSAPEVKTLLTEAIAKLHKYRVEQEKIFHETSVSTVDHAQVSLAFIEAWSATNDDQHLQSALVHASTIKNNHRDTEGRLLRFAHPINISARGEDFAAAIGAATRLYQATLDVTWIEWATALFHEAFEGAASIESPLLQEVQPKDNILPLQLYSYSMVFSSSTQGILDENSTRLLALTGDPQFQKTRDEIASRLQRSVERAPIIHTDFLISCALSDEPIIAVIRNKNGPPAASPLLKALNAPSISPFVTIRSDIPDSSLAPLPELPTATSDTDIVLLRSSQVLGSVNSISEFRTLLVNAFLEKE
ncbi:MAG: DUF255 domain-containing protein [Verrucomicrobiaceae bacterium]